ncbi:glycoside hydrolase domain-containing protein [Agromyces laixinhei]|uniref:glycoside hydrolase domain-containing protein n=1 Tax=Agromyces laixinhei TaxID=2585717 RepID=UPI00111625BD|nr:glycoside hydrolase domain-containing protein [Agromyces laixinhei]
MSDPQVENAQTWLNNTFSGRAGYVDAPMNGETGWLTMYSAIRALQLELGITATSDNFGPGTLAALESQVGNVRAATAATHPNIVGILQLALWCKGYWGGLIYEFWDEDVASSVNSVRLDAGLSAGQTVPPKLFKSLLTMDAYIVIGNGNSETRAVQKWMNGHYLDRADFQMIPCDGIFSRQVQQGLMYALQYEIGMADGVANGNFGPGTQQGIRDHGTASLGDTDGARKMIRLYQAALIFNGYTQAPFTGTFDAATRTQTTGFQQFVELPATGAANFSTWASLLVSTGDVNRPATACDTATPLTSVNVGSITGAGFQVVGRYINGFEKRITHDEPARIWANGRTWFPIYQEWNDTADQFSYSLGYEQGERIASRMRQLGIVTGNRVYLSVDFDATQDDIDAVVVPHFRGVRDALDSSKTVVYKLGVYGTRNVCAQLAAEGLTESSFVSDMSTGYSGNLGFPLPPNWAYDQILTIEVGSGDASIEVDKVVKSTRAQSLSSAQLRRTPRRFTSGQASGFDEAFFWRVAGLAYLSDQVSPDTYMTQGIRDDMVLNWLQKPTYWIGGGNGELDEIWTHFYTPRYPNLFPQDAPEWAAFELAFAEFDARAGSEMYPRPVDAQFGDTTHCAASTRGYTNWGVPAPGATFQVSDIGGWAGDLATFWEDYEAARLASSGGVLNVRAWTAANLGSGANSFGSGDLLADMAAFLWAKRLSNGSGSVDEIARQMLCAIEDDPGWLAKQFMAERFGSRANLVAAAKSVFTSPWPTELAISKLVDVRLPGEPAPTLSPSPTVLATELDGLANGFADVVVAAQQ